MCAQRVKLTELAAPVVEAFYNEEIGVGHALLLAKLQPAQQEQALAACFREDWGGGSKSKRILLPVRHLQQWIEHNILLILERRAILQDVTRNSTRRPEACRRLPQADRTQQAALCRRAAGRLHRPDLLPAKLDAHVAKTSRRQAEAGTNHHGLRQASRRQRRPSRATSTSKSSRRSRRTTEKANWPEFKTCKSTTEAIVTEGIEKGELRKICADAELPGSPSEEAEANRRCQWQSRAGKAAPRGSAGQGNGLARP